MSLDLYARFILALAGVVALIALAGWAAKRFGLAGGIGAPNGRQRLRIVETAAIDGKRRLVLLRRDETEHLILLGSEGALLIERGIPATAQAPRVLEAAQ